jgi:hypothetical protein
MRIACLRRQLQVQPTARNAQMLAPGHEMEFLDYSHFLLLTSADLPNRELDDLESR